MTTEIDTLREALNRSPGWQKIREYTKEGKWEMAEKFVSVPVTEFSWHVDNIEPSGNGRITMSKTAIGSAEVELPNGNLLSISASSPAGQLASPESIVIDEVVEVTTDNQIVAYRSPSMVLVVRKPGRPVELDDAQPTSLKLDTPSREAIATIQTARPELADNSAVIREALKQYAGQMEDEMNRRALELRKHDPAVLERLENARLDALEDEADLKAYRAEHGDDAPDPLEK